ncbi:serine protease inhibitor Kazal-type 1 [Eurytemora carolleeae]|uniref:serine protease inhibitor Kazal-type 1 n=1 Tax=Eurytemora carolleeae TaxID=1294199 RepID=UPI000C788833|nr:serine protease inhibitor Kazal-type 1 [Eurytemora carolleeae]|eukprot:XP_023347964.1 serine protease inhibitor Kazal-type 1-like [Eurytemora affinis]
MKTTMVLLLLGFMLLVNCDDGEVVVEKEVEAGNKTEDETSGVLPSECFLCNCPKIYAAKCGSDGKTYQNECMMECAKEKCPDLTRDLSLDARNIRSGPC